VVVFIENVSAWNLLMLSVLKLITGPFNGRLVLLMGICHSCSLSSFVVSNAAGGPAGRLDSRRAGRPTLQRASTVTSR